MLGLRHSSEAATALVQTMSQPALAQTPAYDERRRFQRVAVDLLGRYMREDRSEYPCRLSNMSPGDVAVLTPIEARRDERIIVYVDHVGRLEGAVTRVFRGGFAMTLAGTERKREKLAAQLTWLANRHELDLPEDRRHERIHPANPAVALVFEDGRRMEARILDLSLSGAAVKTPIRPPIGSRITVGPIQGRVVRHLEEGLAVEFAVVQDRDNLQAIFS